MGQLINKNAFVTGGSRGIGAAIVRKFVSEGANVAFTFLNSPEKAADMVSELEKYGGKVLAIQADSGNIQSVTDAVNQAGEFFGILDILVNSAGIIVLGSLEDSESLADQYERQIDINIRGIYAAVRAASRHLADGGRIITIGSVAATALGTSSMTDYAATKAAAAAYTRGYAWDFGARGITVNIVQPGPINTDMNPDQGDLADFLRSKNALKRYGTKEEVAALVNFLAGPDSGFITGATINIDGGSLA